ncbi:hypothetical protein [Listeria newyorkensis]|uniref:hypothetical protein n=1 Tax=Listeria newyorkensis TaxID=1497681 RepID=UPI0010F78CE6|nr:hypothetical protein [Listeria newyorkensis]
MRTTNHQMQLGSALIVYAGNRYRQTKEPVQVGDVIWLSYLNYKYVNACALVEAVSEAERPTYTVRMLGKSYTVYPWYKKNDDVILAVYRKRPNRQEREERQG